MARIKVLTKYFLRSSFDGMIKKSKKKTIALIFLIMICILCPSIPITCFIGMEYENLSVMNLEYSLINFILLTGSSISCFLGIYTILNIFYFEDDIETILPLPFKSREIVIAKFITVIFNMYFFTVIIVPPLILYGIKSGGGIIYYLYVILTFILQPIIPMIFASLICIIVMRFTNLSKHKDLFKIISGTLFFLLIIVFNFFNSNEKFSFKDEMNDLLFKNDNKGINILNTIFINNKFSSNALINSNTFNGFLNMILCILICISIFILYYYLSGNIYLKSIMGISESNGERKDVLNDKSSSKLIKRNSILSSLVYKDIKLIFRTPQFFINCVVMLLYIPLILTIAFFTGDNLEYFRSLIDIPYKYGSQFISGSFVLGSVCLLNGGAAQTALTRDAKDIMSYMYLPIDSKTFLKSKILSSFAINSIGIIIGIILFAILKPSISMYIFCLISYFCGMCVLTMIELYIDFKDPKLEWSNEKDMFKNNFKTILILIITFVLGIAIFIISNFISHIKMLSICIALTIIIFYILKKKLDVLNIQFWKWKMIQ